MDFVKFIEKDMIEFLDDQTNNVADKAASLREEEFNMYEITKDFSKDIENALKSNDLRKAQSIFDDVKKQYQAAPAQSLNKKRLYIILEQVYEKIKDYEAKEEGKKTLFDTIQDFENEAILTNPKLMVNNESAISLLLKNIDEKEKEIDSITNTKPFTGKELGIAVKQYKEMKSMIEKIPSANKDKVKAAEKAVNWYFVIKKKEKEVTEGNKTNAETQASENKENISIDARLSNIRKMKEEIVKLHTSINSYLATHNVMKSMIEYKKLRMICESLPEELGDEKSALISESQSLYSRISALRDELIPANTPANATNNKMAAEPAAKPSLKQKTDDNNAVLDKISREISILHEEFHDAFSKNNISKCTTIYDRLNKISDSFPEEFREEKTALLVDIIGANKKIEELKKNLAEKQESILAEQNEKKSRAQSRDICKKEIIDIIEKVKDSLGKRDCKKAIQDYKAAKKLFEKYPEDNIDEKKSLYDEIISAHKDILMLENDLKRKSSFNPEESRQKISEIENLLSQAKKIISSKNKEDATNMILEAKHKIQLLPKEEFDKKYSLIKNLEELEHSILFMSNIERIDQSSEQNKAASS